MAARKWIVAAMLRPVIDVWGWIESFHADRKSTRLNSSHSQISYAVFCLKKNTTYLVQAPSFHLSARGTLHSPGRPSPSSHRLNHFTPPLVHVYDLPSCDASPATESLRH